jgi:hypothetical protein
MPILDPELGETPEEEPEGKNKFYFQIRLDNTFKNLQPRIFFGLCREDFLVNLPLSKQKKVWCLSLASGDTYDGVKWRNYYDNDPEDPKIKPKYGRFRNGTVIGILIDKDRGFIKFYKDGFDLGTAFVSPDIKEGDLYPFIQLNDKANLHIFSKEAHVFYKEPPSEESILKAKLEEEKE